MEQQKRQRETRKGEPASSSAAREGTRKRVRGDAAPTRSVHRSIGDAGMLTHSPRGKHSRQSENEEEPVAAVDEYAGSLYRLMHKVPRSDQLQIKKCRLNYALCERAAQYFQEDFTTYPLRHLTLQVGCGSGDASASFGVRRTGIQLFFPHIFHHKAHLRQINLSRNDLTQQDVRRLCEGLGLLDQPSPTHSPLRLLDLSYNSRVGNEGALLVFRAVSRQNHLKALLLRCIGVDDAGATLIAPFLRDRPPPVTPEDCEDEGTSTCAASFFVNLNENRIGARGSWVLGKHLPSYVSLTLCRQNIFREC